MIGEAASRFSDESLSAASDVLWKEIIGFRNIAARAYFSVDWRIVFVTFTDDLPELKSSVIALLGSL